MSTLTIDLDSSRYGALRKIARESGQEPDALVRDAIEAFFEDFENEADLPPLTEEERASIRRGVEQADRGEGVPAEEVLKNIRAGLAR